MSTEDNKLDPYKMSFKPGFKLTAAEANAVRKFLGGLNEGLFVKCTDCGQFAQFDGSVISVQQSIQWVRCGACEKRNESSGSAGSVTAPFSGNSVPLPQGLQWEAAPNTTTPNAAPSHGHTHQINSGHRHQINAAAMSQGLLTEEATRASNGTFVGSTRERIDAIAAKGVTTRMKP